MAVLVLVGVLVDVDVLEGVLVAVLEAVPV